MVPEARIELARGKTSTDFKSVASTNIYKINKHQLPNVNFVVVKILSKISQAVNNTP